LDIRRAEKLLAAAAERRLRVIDAAFVVFEEDDVLLRSVSHFR
jgi:hypothetical protein